MGKYGPRTSNVYSILDRGGWHSAKLSGGRVIRHNDSYVMLYTGFRDKNRAQIGAARSHDGVTGWHWRQANPLIRPGHAARGIRAQSASRLPCLMVPGGFCGWGHRGPKCVIDSLHGPRVNAEYRRLWCPTRSPS